MYLGQRKMNTVTYACTGAGGWDNLERKINYINWLHCCFVGIAPHPNKSTDFVYFLTNRGVEWTPSFGEKKLTANWVYTVFEVKIIKFVMHDSEKEEKKTQLNNNPFSQQKKKKTKSEEEPEGERKRKRMKRFIGTFSYEHKTTNAKSIIINISTALKSKCTLFYSYLTFFSSSFFLSFCLSHFHHSSTQLHTMT